MALRPLSSTAAALVAAAVAATSWAATPALGSVPASGRLGAVGPATQWGPPHVLADSFYYVDDLGHDHGAVGSWLARVELGGSGSPAVGYQELRQRGGDGLIRPAVAVRDADGTWDTRVLAGRDRTGYTWVGADRRGRTTVVWFAENADDHTDPTVRWVRRNAAGVWGEDHRFREVDGRPTDFHVTAAGYGVLSFVSRKAAWVKVLTPAGTWRPRVRVSADQLGRGVAKVAAVVSGRGRVTAAFWSITVDTRSETSGPLQRGGVRADGRRLPVRRLAHLGQSEHFSVVGSPGGSAAVQLGSTAVAYRLAGDRWRTSERPVTAVSVGAGAVVVASRSAEGATPLVYSLAEYTRATQGWSSPRVVASVATDEQVGIPLPHLVRAGHTNLLGFTVSRSDTSPVTFTSRVVTDVDSRSTVEQLPGCLVDLDAQGIHAALLTTPACQPGGPVTVRTR